MSEVTAELAGLRQDLRGFELRFAAKLEAMELQLLAGIRRMIFWYIVINVIATVGGMFGLAKLLGH